MLDFLASVLLWCWWFSARRIHQTREPIKAAPSPNSQSKVGLPQFPNLSTQPVVCWCRRIWGSQDFNRRGSLSLSWSDNDDNNPRSIEPAPRAQHLVVHRLRGHRGVVLNSDRFILDILENLVRKKNTGGNFYKAKGVCSAGCLQCWYV